MSGVWLRVGVTEKRFVKMNYRVRNRNATTPLALLSLYSLSLHFSGATLACTDWSLREPSGDFRLAKVGFSLRVWAACPFYYTLLYCRGTRLSCLHEALLSYTCGLLS